MSATTSDVRQDDIVVYLLAASADEQYSEKIRRYLKPVARESTVPITFIDDFDITASMNRDQHRAQLLEADVVLTLVSSDFIDDDSVYERGNLALERYNDGQNVVVSILVRNCLWKKTPYADLPLLPTNKKPVNRWEPEDDAFTDIAEHLAESIEQVAHVVPVAPSPPPSPPTASPPPAPPAPPPAAATSDVAEQSVDDSATEAATSPLAPPTAPADAVSSPPAVAPTFDPPAAAPGPKPAAATPRSAGTTNGFRVVRKSTSKVSTDWRDDYYRSLIKRRVGAYFIDYVIQLTVFVLAIASMGEDSGGASIVLVGVLFGALPWMESKFRATPGKLVLGLEITNPDGSRISFWRAFWRNFLRSLTFYAYVFIVGLIIQRRRFPTTHKLFHDEWSKTIIGERISD